MIQLTAIRYIRAICILPILILIACVEVPVKDTEPEQQVALFYPALPDPPRIQYLASFTDESDLGSGPGTFGKFILGDDIDDREGVKKPYGVSLVDGRIYVADTRGGGYVIFDLQDESYKTVVGAGTSAMPKPTNIVVTDDGTKYVADTIRKKVLVFDAKDHFVKAYGVKGQFKPGDMVSIGDKLYVSDMEHHNIQVLDKETGDVLSTFSKVGSQEGELYHPTNLALGPNNHLYVSDTGNFRIQEFTLDGEFVQSFGSVGTATGSFARPKGVAVDRDGRIYVVDAAFENVQVFNNDGQLLMFFGEPGTNHPAGLNLPTDITIDYASVPYFQKYAEPNFRLEYIILVASQYGFSKVNAFGFGRMDGLDYSGNE